MTPAARPLAFVLLIQLASSLPLERFAPGAYELRLVLSDGQDEEIRTAAASVVP